MIRTSSTKKFWFLVPTFFLSLTLLSCGGQSGVVQQFELGLDFDNFGRPQSDEFIQKFNKVYERLRAQHPNSERLKTQFIKKDVPQSSDTIKWNELNSKQNILFFFSSGFYFTQTQNLAPPSRPTILLQTLTHAFRFDPLPVYYQDGSFGDYLLSWARKQNALFHSMPFSQWKDTAFGWNGIRYNDFYTTQLIDFYRGSIWIRGSEEKLRKIQEAWQAKDWRTFRSFGILLGEPRHNTRWKLPEALFKKHFNLPNNTFTDFLTEQMQHPDLFRNDKAWFMASRLNQNYHIAFDDEASFAWTLSTSQNASYYTAPPKQKIQIFLLTDPLLYDIAVVNNSLDPLQRELIAQTFLEMAQQGIDTFGPSIGFNGYRKVQDEEKEFFSRMSKTLQVK